MLLLGARKHWPLATKARNLRRYRLLRIPEKICETKPARLRLAARPPDRGRCRAAHSRASCQPRATRAIRLTRKHFHTLNLSLAPALPLFPPVQPALNQHDPEQPGPHRPRRATLLRPCRDPFPTAAADRRRAEEVRELVRAGREVEPPELIAAQPEMPALPSADRSPFDF
jgi:hypothetical protein